jgi:tetratricopeptide (TPR) repeat protein
LGSVPLAIEHYEQAAALFEMTHDSNNLARAYGNLAGLLGTQGKLDRAFDYYERSNVHFRAVGDRRGEALNMINMGADQLSLYQFDAALTVYQQSLAICREINDPGLALFSLNGIASIYQSLGVYDKALAFFGESLSLSRMVKDVYTEVGNLGNIGSVYVALGQYEAGIERLNAALALADPNNLDQEKHYKRTFLASALLFKGDLPGALDAIRQARAIDVPLNNANALQLEGVILARQGRFDLARAAFEQAITNCDQLLAEMPHFAAALFTRGGARAGLAICGMDAVPAALADMRAGKAVCSARGILEDAARSLGALMQCPNGETLRPLEALLLSAQD